MRYLKTGLTLFVLLYSLAGYADLSREQQLFLDAETALKKGDIKQWHKLEPLLKGYPLYADLKYKEAIQSIAKTMPEQAEKTLLLLKDTPLQKSYRRSWLKRLAKRKRWQQYLKYYAPGLGTAFKCHYANALYQNNQVDKAGEIARQLWLVGKSQPDECNEAFKQLKAHKQLTNELIWERITLAMKKGKSSLVKYLKRSLPVKEQKYVDEWLAVRSKPERVLKNRYIQSDNPIRQQILVYGIRRMALFEADRALKHWQSIKDKTALTNEQQQDIEAYIALRMTTQKLPGAVEQHHNVTTPDRAALEWAARAALQEVDWKSLERFVAAMGDFDQLTDRWRYWKAIAAKQLGKQAKADTLLHLLTTDRGYHNYLAADELGLNYVYADKPLTFSQVELKALQDNYNVKRTRELYQLDRIAEARREWYYLKRKHGDEDRQKLAYIIKQWDWHSQAILTIATADYYDDLSIRFPVLYAQEVSQAASKNGLDPAWIMALMRQESAFQPDARSPAGARGLMQLMPATSRHVARLLRERRPKLRDLYKPETNIKLGTHYLKTNLKTFANHLVLTTAAYNAGPHRVKKWLLDDSLSAPAWVEAIPFKETRGYVQRIMSYAPIYEKKLGLPSTRLRQRMPPIPAKQNLP